MVLLAPPRPRSFGARVRCLATGRVGRDVVAVGALLAATAVAARPILVGGTMIGQDTAAFFYPIFSALGDRLAAGDVPGWNPHQFAGVPFAADPESGWMYLPAMLLFTALPIAAAASLWIVGHLLLAGLGTYALGRVLGLGALGALTAGVAVEFSGLVFARTVCCPAYGQVASWLPVLLLSAELAGRAPRLVPRLAWWGAAGFALAHIFVAWLGQGAYYALLAFALFVVYRATVLPAASASPLRSRLAMLPLHGGVPVLIGFALSAAAIMPRLAYFGRTNLADGYSGELAWAANLGGWDPAITIGQLLNPTFYYAGAGVLALATVALPLVRARYAAPVFAALGLGAVVLAQHDATLLHRGLSALLPRFDELHRHWPERDMVVFYLGPAMLAGSAIHAVARMRRRSWASAGLSFAPVALALALDAGVGSVGSVPLRAAFAVSLGLLVLHHAPSWGRRLVPPLLALTVLVELFAVGRYNLDHGLYGGFHRVDLAGYYAPSAASAFLAERAANGEPSRFFGYDPGIHPADGTPPLYRYLFADPRARALLLNNRATILGLHDVQGYNPIQPQRYVDYMRALNGFAQEYHEANVYPGGLGSPLLDLLNARYVVVPATVPHGRSDLVDLVDRLPTVHLDADVRVLENVEVLPRAWIVHEARQTSPDQALALLSSGGVDPRRVALLNEPAPALAQAVDPGTDEVAIVGYEPDRIRLRTRTDAPGLLVLSETADPDWRASLDGETVPILVANGLLRAVPIPSGDHVVELEYASAELRLGTIISVASYALLAGIWSAAGRRAFLSIRDQRQ